MSVANYLGAGPTSKNIPKGVFTAINQVEANTIIWASSPVIV